MSIPPLDAVGAAMAADPVMARSAATAAASPAGVSFSQLLMNGVEHVEQKLAAADVMASAFAVDDSIPLHRVTYALEEARLSFELMLQVRARLVEAYQEVSRMQL